MRLSAVIYEIAGSEHIDMAVLSVSIDPKRKHRALSERFFLICILTGCMFDGVSRIKYSTTALVPLSAQVRVAASHFQFEV